MSETLKIKCPVVEGNDLGFYVIEAKDLVDGMKLFGEVEVKSPEDAPAQKAPEDMTVAELKATLAEAGMDVPEHAKKADLIALCLSLPE